MANCAKHAMLRAQSPCFQCGHDYCDECLVFPFGPAKPMCIGCALAFAGVNARPVARRREARPTWGERRRRRQNRPEVPEVTLLEPSLDLEAGVELPAWGR